MTTTEVQVREMLLSDKLPYFARWLGEVWGNDGLDTVVAMLQKPWNWLPEWQEYNWLCERFDTYAPECRRDEMDENSDDFRE